MRSGGKDGGGENVWEGEGKDVFVERGKALQLGEQGLGLVDGQTYIKTVVCRGGWVEGWDD